MRMEPPEIGAETADAWIDSLAASRDANEDGGGDELAGVGDGGRGKRDIHLARRCVVGDRHDAGRAGA